MSENQSTLLGAAKVHTATFKSQAYDLIKDAILYNRFRVDAVYSQEAICNELGISRTPVREALLELQKEGYVSFARGKGVKVIPVTEHDAVDILEARIFLEPNNARLAAERGTPEEKQSIMDCLTGLKQNLSTLDSRLLYRIDHQFHRMVANASHNEWFSHQTSLILDHYLRFEIKSVYNNSIDGKLVFEEHYAIGKEIFSGHAEKAALAMKQHLSNSYTRTLGPIWKSTPEQGM